MARAGRLLTAWTCGLLLLWGYPSLAQDDVEEESYPVEQPLIYNENYEAETPIPIPSTYYADACAHGVSVQGMSFGGAIGSGNSVCDYIMISNLFIQLGDRDGALEALNGALSHAKWRGFFSKVRSVLTLGLL